VLELITIRGGYAYGDEGGGIWIGGTSSPTIRQCIFTANVAAKDDWDFGGGGGALAIYLAAPRIEGCTFLDNQAAYGGAGLAHRFGCPPDRLHLQR